MNLWMQLEIEWRVWKVYRKLPRQWRWLQLQSCGQFKCVLKILVAFGNHLLHFLGILQVCLYTIYFLLFIDTWAVFLSLFVGTYILQPLLCTWHVYDVKFFFPTIVDLKVGLTYFCWKRRCWCEEECHCYHFFWQGSLWWN